MPNTIEELSSNLGSLNISSREPKSDGMTKTFREVSEAAASYGDKEPHTASVRKISSNDEDSEDDEDRDDDDGKFVNDEDSDDEGGQFVNDDDSDDEEIKEVTAKCGKDQKPKTQNRGASRPYNFPNRLGAVNVTHEHAQSESAASRFFDERNYTTALAWLIDAKNRQFPENAIIVQLDKLKNSIDQNNQNKYSEFQRIFCKPNHEEVTALFFAAIHNYMRTTEYLVKEIFQNGFPSPHQAKAYFNQQDRAGNTLLHEMAYVGDSVASTMSKLFEFRFPDAKHTLFDYRIKNLSQQYPIHYCLENCLTTPQYQMIDLFYTVDKDILKVLDSKGNNLLFCFINSCQKAYPLHGNVDSRGLETVKKYLNILFRYPETSGYGCRELVNGHHQHMEPTIWTTIDNWLRAAKIEADQTKPDDDECQIIYSGTTQSLVEKKQNQEKQTPVVLVPRVEKKQQTSVQEEDSMDSGDLIPVFVTQRSQEFIKEEPYKKGGNKAKGSARKTSRHSSKDEGYQTSNSITPAISPGTSPHHASTSGKTYFEMNESSTTIPTTIPLFVEDMSTVEPVTQLNQRSGDKIYSKPITSPPTPTFRDIVPNPIKMALKPTSYVKMSLAPTTYSQVQPSPSIYSQNPTSPNTNTLIPPSPNPQSYIPASPSSFSQISPSPSMYSQMSPAYSTHSQMSPTSSTYSQMSPPQSVYSQVSASPNTYSPVSPFPSTYSQMSPSSGAYSQMSPPPSTYKQMSPPPSTYSQMSSPPNTYSQMSTSSGAYSQMTPSYGAYEMLKLLPQTACPDASTVLDAINETNPAATTSATRYHPQSHAEQVQNLEAGNQIDLVLNVTENDIFQVDSSALHKGTMLIDAPSLSQFQGQTTMADQPDQINFQTTQEFDDFLEVIGITSGNTEAEVEEKMMPAIEVLLNTPQVEKPAFSFNTASRK